MTGFVAPLLPNGTTETNGRNADDDREQETNVTQQNLGIGTQGNNNSPLHDIANVRGFKYACVNINSLYRQIDEITSNK